MKSTLPQLTKSLAYGNHDSTRAHEGLVWEILKEAVRRDHVFISDKVAAVEIKGLRLSPLGAMAMKKVRISSDYTFKLSGQSVGGSAVDADTSVDQVPPCLCAEALPRLLYSYSLDTNTQPTAFNSPR